jgi:TonB family protein
MPSFTPITNGAQSIEVPSHSMPPQFDGGRPARSNLILAGFIGALIGVVALVGIGGAIVYVAKGGTKSSAAMTPTADPSPATTPKIDPPPIAAAGAATLPPSTHEISVRVSPSSAQIAFDGKDAGNPARRNCTAGQRVIVRATAAGYAPRERELRCDRDESLELLLSPQGSSKAAELAAQDAKLAAAARVEAASPPPSPIDNTTPRPAEEPAPVAAPTPAPASEGAIVPFAEGMTRPSPISPGEIQYTREAREANVQGTMIVRCVITTSGATESCRILKGLPFMDQAVLSALSRHKGTPVMSQGKPVTAEYTFTIRLKKD